MSSSSTRLLPRALWLGAATAPLLFGAHAAFAGTEGATAVVAGASDPIEVVGKRATPLDIGTGLSVLPTSIQDTPQAVSIVDAKTLKEQGVASLEQALRNVPGITIAIGEGGTLNGDQFKIRGFDASSDMYIDGLRDFGVYTRDSFDYNEVQVLKGPSGALFGRGSVGGAINTVSKMPKLSNFSEVDAYAGNGDYYRGLGDFNVQLGPHTAARLNVMGTSQGVVDRDHIFSKRWGLAGAIGFGLGTNTTFTLNVFHQDDRRRPDYGLIILQPPGSLIASPVSEYGVDRSTFMGYRTDADHTRADIVTGRFESKLSPNLTITSDSRIGAYSRYFQYTPVDSCSAACTTAFFDGNPATVPYANFGGGGPYKQRDWGAQNISTARYDFDLGGFKNEMIVGWDLSYQKNKKTFYPFALPPGVTARNTIPKSIYDPPYDTPPGYARITAAALTCPVSGTCTTVFNGQTVSTNFTSTTAVYGDGYSTDVGGFITDRLYITPQLSLLGSLREDHYEAQYTSVTPLKVPSTLNSNSDLFDPRLSLVFEPSKTQTYYLSAGRSSTPQGTAVIDSATPLAATSAALKPEISTSYEAGAKVGVLHGRLSLTASVFDILKSNATQTDPDTGFIEVNSSQRQEVKGIELGATGKITSDWTMTVGYTYLDARIRKDYSCSTTAPLVCNPNPYTIGRQVVFVPRNAASLWTTYDLHAFVPGLSVGGGVTYQSLIYGNYYIAGTAPNPTGLSKITEIPESLSFDGYVAYNVGRYRLGLNAYNLGDRLNYTQVFSTRAVPAPGRTIIASLGVKF